MSEELAVSAADVEAAAERIAPHVLTTPCLPNERLSDLVGCEAYLKCENLQHIGAFKARGATNAVLQLPADATSGVVAHSSGNHAAALARAAKLAGVKAHIVMPENSAKIKIEAVQHLGVTPIFCEPNAESRDAVAKRIQDDTGAALVHPYDNPDVIAGQGTVGLEILEAVDSIDAILAPVGGGGLISGILRIVKARRPDVKVYAVEPEWADDAARSLDAGKILMPTRYDSIADGLRSPLGERTFPILRSLVDGILLVSESQIKESMRLLATLGRTVAEPSGAVAFAGLRANASKFAGQKVAVVITGGNLDFGSCGLGQ